MRKMRLREISTMPNIIKLGKNKARIQIYLYIMPESLFLECSNPHGTSERWEVTVRN